MANKEFQVRHGLAVNNNVLVANTVTGNVSIGSNTASYKLDVAGTVRANRLRTWNSASNADWDAFEILSSGASSILKSYGDETGLILRSESGNIILADDRGNVGIGTSNPQAALDVYNASRYALRLTGPVSNGPIFDLYRQNTRTAFIETDSSNNFLLAAVQQGPSLSLRTNGGAGPVDRLVITTDGNVGIGTSAPAYKLDVNGDARITGNLTLGDASTDNVTFNASNFNFANNVNFDSGTLYIDAANNRVGVGTTTPATPLHILGTTTFSPTSAESTTTGGNLVIRMAGTSTGGYNVMEIAGGNNNIWTTGSGIQFFTHGGRLIQLGSNFYVSSAISAATIGLFGAAPGAVANGVWITSGSKNYITSMRYADTYYPDLVVSAPNLYFNTKFGAAWADGNGGVAYGTTRVAITANGYVGIGTITPSANLHVIGDAIFTGNVTVSGNTSYMNTQTLLIGDNLITLNADIPSNTPGTEDAGIEVNRGSLGNASFIWDETNDRWDVRANNSNLISILSTGGVGIGTTSPGTKLEIKGIDSAISFDIVGSGASALPCIGFNRNVLTGGIYNSSVSGWQFSARDSYFALEGYNGVNTFATASGSIFAITKANAFVGIGTTTPSQRLTVAGGQILVGPTDSGNSYINFYNTGYRVGAAAGLEIQTGGTDVVRFLRGSTETVRIDGSGNMGIGTTSPASIFNVNAGASGGGAIFSSQGFNYATVSQIISSADAVFGGGVIASNVGGELIKTVANDVHYFKAQITDGLTFHTGITGAAGTAVPRTTNERMRINANGNVGIGTTSPAHKLDVLGNVRVYNSLYNDSVLTIGATSGSVGTQQRIVFNDGTNQTGGIFSYGSAYGSGFSNGISIGTNVISNTSLATSFNYAASTVASLYSQLSGAHIWYNAASGTAGNAISWSERMRIDASGNVSIGSASTVGYGGYVGLSIGSTSVTGLLKLRSAYNSGNGTEIWQDSTGKLFFNTNSSTTFMVADVNGNVGIGTTSPASRLHVDSTLSLVNDDTARFQYDYGTAAIRLIGASASSQAIYFGTSADNKLGRFVFDNNNQAFIFISNASERMRIDSSGQVGIGTTSPAFPLHVNSSISAIGTTTTSGRIWLREVGASANANAIELHLRPNAGKSAYLTFTEDTIDDRWSIGTQNGSGALRFISGTPSGTERMRINTNGNVGIANSAPDALLHVAGTTILGGDTVGTMDVKFSRLLGGIRAINHWFTQSANSPWYLFGQNMTWTGERTGTVDPTHAHRPYYEAYAPVVGYKEFGFANVSSGSIASSNLIANMVLTNTGNVGIGTTAPGARLEVAALNDATVNYPLIIRNQASTGAGGGSGTGVQFISHSGIDAGKIYAVNDVSGSTSMVFTNFVGEFMRGNGSSVCIGTTATTSAKLRVVAGAGLSALSVAGAGNAGLIIDYLGASDNYYDAGTHIFRSTSGTTERMRITSGGDVMINQTSSSGTGKLGVAGRIAIDVNGSDSFSGQLYLTSPNGWPSNIQAAGPSSNGIAFWTYTGSWSERVRITGAGNVGINTSSPSSRLHVVAANSAYTDSGIFELGDSSRNGLSMGYDGTNNWSWIYSRSVGVQSRPISFNNSTLHIGQSGGAVGINTSAPSGTFQTAGSGDQNIYFSHTDNAAGRTVSLRLGSSNQTYLNRSTYIQAIEGSGIDNYSLAFGTTSGTDASAQERMRITREGNAGIGTASPGLYTGHTTLAINNATYGGLIDLLTNGTRHLTLYSGTASSIIGTVSSTALTFLSHNTERMRIDSAGNVGIGTSAPQTRLHVGTKITDDAGYTYDSNTFMAIHQSPTGTSRLNDPKTVMMLARQGWGGEAYGAAVAFDLSRYENSGVFSRTRLDITLANNNFIAQNTTVMTLLSGGNVGIGTTAPGAKLDVATNSVWGTSSVAAINLTNTGSSGNVNNPHGLGAISWLTNQSAIGATIEAIRNSPGNGNYSSILFSTNDTANGGTVAERMRITNAGNIGIGTTSITQDISGSERVLQVANTNAASLYLHSTNGNKWQISSITGGSLSFYNNAVQRMTIDSSGNVAIGQSSTTYKLQVNGSFAANTKSFVIDHPTKPGMKLRHGSLEGPENGVYVRGKTKEKVIELPEYWRGLIDSSTITVQLTAIGRSQNLYVVDVSDNRVYIDSENYTDVDCYYYIQAERKDVEKLVVEY